MSNAMAEGTLKNHRANINKFQRFCKYFKQQSAPPTTDTLVLYLEWLAQKSGTIGTVVNSLSSIKLYCKINNFPVQIFEMFIVKLMMKAVKRTLPFRKNKRKLISPITFKNMLAQTSVLGTSQHVVKLALTLGYMGLLRVSNCMPKTLSQFKPNQHSTFADLNIVNRKLVLTMKWSKTRVNTEETHIILPEVKDPEVSPVNHYQNMLMANKHLNITPKHPMLIFPSGAPILSPFYNRITKFLAKKTVGTSRGYTSHSFRRSGATFYYAAGATALQLAKQGTWASPQYLTYILSDSTMPSPVQKASDKIFNSLI